MLQYLRKQAELQKSFNSRAAAKRRRVGAEVDEGRSPEQRQTPQHQQQVPAEAAAADGASNHAAAGSGGAAPMAADNEKEAADRAEGQRLIEAMRKDYDANSPRAAK